MITREEYETVLKNGNVAECIIASGAYISSLEQHIKSLEAQLDNTEQLTCIGCKYYDATMYVEYCDGCKRNENILDFYTKDTQ